MKITVAGIGHVGLLNAVLLSQNHEVVAFDSDKERVAMVRAQESPVADRKVYEYLKKASNLTATADPYVAFSDADYILISTPTDYDPKRHRLDTATVEAVVWQALEIAPDAAIVIQSAVPIGFTAAIKRRYFSACFLFSPVFFREGQAPCDDRYPSRIVVGVPENDFVSMERANVFAQLLMQSASERDIPILITKSTEAEAIKLFSSAYLAMRTAFFNELDSYAEFRNLDARQIIAGVGLDPRIGKHDSNPSFGYGGYCLSKDTKQLLANYAGIPNNIIAAIISANKTRKDFIAERILERTPHIVGIYRLTENTGLDQIGQSAVQDVMKRIKVKGVQVVVYEPSLKQPYFLHSRVLNDINTFKAICDVIVADRFHPELADVLEKVYTRDLSSGE